MHTHWLWCGSLTRHAGPQQRLLVLAQALVVLVELLDLLQGLLGRGFVVEGGVGGVGGVDGRSQLRQLLWCRLLLCHFLLIGNRVGGGRDGAMVNNGGGGGRNRPLPPFIINSALMESQQSAAP